MRFKGLVKQKFSSLMIMLSVSGAFRAWQKGCYVTVYEFIKKMEALGIRPQTVIDIGANRGMFSKCLNRIFPNAHIYAFEPLSDCYRELESLKSSIHSLTTYNYALGNRTETATIYRSSYDYSSSLLLMGDLHKRVFPQSAELTKNTVAVRTLDSVVNRAELCSPVLMKIDVQGFELAVLQGAQNTLEVVDFVVCEISFRPLYDGQPLFDELYDFLRSAGFKFRGSVGELRDPDTDELLQIDGLFTRD